jgi:replicative DNA helicase
MAENPLPETTRKSPQTNGESGRQTKRDSRSFSQKPGTYLQDIHRALPSSLDAEKGVLCSTLLAPDRVIDECIEYGITEKYFHLPAHGLVYSTAIEMREAGRPVDMISITQYLQDRQKLEEAGGASAIADLFTFIPTAANAGYYMEILREKYLLRQIVTVCNEYAYRAYNDQDEVKNLLDEVEEGILKIRDDRFGPNVGDMKRLTEEALDKIEALHSSRGQITGLATGFSGIDDLTDGLHPGEMFVIAARPSMGKTALAMNIVEHAAIEGGKSVAVYSLEMSTQQLMQRLLCSCARVDIGGIRKHKLHKNAMRGIVDATNRLSVCKMYIDDTPGLSILELRARARRLKNRHGIDLVVIDYLQLLRSPTKRGLDNRQVEVAEISAGIKALAKELSVPVLVLAQLNRNPESRTGGSKGRPRLSDLRESGSIEQDADVVALLWREDYYAEDEEAKKDSEGKAELVIAKQRNGPTGDIPLTFLREFTRFEDRAVGRDDIPG